MTLYDSYFPSNDERNTAVKNDQTHWQEFISLASLWFKSFQRLTFIQGHILFLIRMGKSENKFFRIPKVKDDVMKIVCVLLNVFISGLSFWTYVIPRYWYYSWCCPWWNGCERYPLWCSPVDLWWFLPWLCLVLGVGLLHCRPEAGLLSLISVCFCLLIIFEMDDTSLLKRFNLEDIKALYKQVVGMNSLY